MVMVISPTPLVSRAMMKLSIQDKKLKCAQVVERNVFDRKWWPSHTQDSSIVVEN
jgi:hypothetical protein